MKEVWDKNKDVQGAIPGSLDIPSTSELYYKKLCSYLLLLYQWYLRGETDLEPEIKMALWRMIQLKDDFSSKIRMLHQDYAQKDPGELNSDWEKVKDIIFPERVRTVSTSDQNDNLIIEYKETVLQLLASNI